MAHGRRFRIEKQLGAFLRQYGRRGRSPHDANDRGYDRKIEAQLKRLRPEELDSLLQDESPVPLLAARLRIVFDRPANGWMRTHISTHSADADLVVSHTPNDFVEELVRAVANASEMTGTYRAVANEEPREIVFEFRRASNHLTFAAYDHATGETLIEFAGMVRQVILPFWRSLRRLEAVTPAEWQWPFPHKEMAQLTEIADALKTAG